MRELLGLLRRHRVPPCWMRRRFLKMSCWARQWSSFRLSPFSPWRLHLGGDGRPKQLPLRGSWRVDVTMGHWVCDVPACSYEEVIYLGYE